MEQNKHILRQAIQHLPEYMPKESSWEFISGKIQNKMSSELSDMEQRKPRKDVWEKLSNRLRHETWEEENYDALRIAIRELPNYQAPEVWTEMQQRLHPRKIGLQLENKRWFVGIAASILLIVGLFWIVNPIKTNVEGYTVQYDVEKVEVKPNVLLSEEAEEADLLDYIQYQCASVQLQCEKPYFKDLMQQYQDLTQAEEELKKEISKMPNDQLLKYQIRIRKERVEISKELFQYLAG